MIAPRASIRIQPLGRVRPRVLAALRRRLARVYRMPVEVAPRRQYLRGLGYSPRRDQYRADILLDHLSAQVPPDGTCLLGVTEEDIYVPHYNFLFGLAYVGDRCAVFSLYRLDDDFPEDADPRQGPAGWRLIDRAVKIAVHELGHAFGLGHCRDGRCVMHYADNVDAVDRESGRHCEKCRPRLASAVAPRE
ncbi:MAG: archaemetzincin family Zn-dependent metalloprotease [Armatimonadetes bacterium]|nr:archaemetzincin family Zn-dependent metalloprotease [Armatimonadota bacterium]